MISYQKNEKSQSKTTENKQTLNKTALLLIGLDSNPHFQWVVLFLKLQDPPNSFWGHLLLVL